MTDDQPGSGEAVVEPKLDDPGLAGSSELFQHLPVKAALQVIGAYRRTCLGLPSGAFYLRVAM